MKSFQNTLPFAACLVGLALILAAAPVPADILHLDDVIIDGSLCVGFDCVNGESFSFDTIRLKENNLRISFIDTSTAASYPRGDWQIRANDSSNGGLNRFSVDWLGTSATSGNSISRTPMTIEGNAPSHSLYVDDGGRLGLGTSVPVVDVHIKTGNTPTLRLEQDTSSGFAAQTWDVAGNEAGFFVRDATGGSTLPFRIRAGGPPSSSIDIASDGDVGIGTGSPSEELHVRRTDGGPTRILVENTGANQTGMQFVNSVEDWRFTNDGAGRFVVNAAGGAGNEFLLESNGDITITGEITTNGSCSIGCDAVFEPDYEVESIDQHASMMWSNRHLPAVGPTPEEGPFNLTRKAGGMLNELEKAHIYIEQLHRRLEKLERDAAAEDDSQ